MPYPHLRGGYESSFDEFHELERKFWFENLTWQCRQIPLIESNESVSWLLPSEMGTSTDHR